MASMISLQKLTVKNSLTKTMSKLVEGQKDVRKIRKYNFDVESIGSSLFNYFLIAS